MPDQVAQAVMEVVVMLPRVVQAPPLLVEYWMSKDTPTPLPDEYSVDFQLKEIATAAPLEAAV